MNGRAHQGESKRSADCQHQYLKYQETPRLAGVPLAARRDGARAGDRMQQQELLGEVGVCADTSRAHAVGSRIAFPVV